MLLYHLWQELPITTRILIAENFSIKKTGATHVANNAIVNDGYAIKEIEEKLNKKSLQEFLDTEESDVSILWSMLIDKMENREFVKKVEEKKPSVTSLKNVKINA